MEKETRSELSLLRETFLGEVSSEAQRLKVCLLATFLLGLIAHGFGLTHLLIGHDSLHEFYWTVSRQWKMSLGRFLEPILRYVMGEIIVLPWLTGLTGLLFGAVAAHLVGKMFRLQKVWANVAVCGVMVTNVTVTALIATYIHDFAGDMLALLLAVAAAYCWSRMREGFSWKDLVTGTLCLTASFGFYQAYVAVTVTLICMAGILDLLKERSAKKTLLSLLRALPMGILAVGIYLIGVSVAMKVFGVTAAGDAGNNMNYISQNLSRWRELLGAGYGQVMADLFLVRWDSVKGVHAQAALLVCAANAGLGLLAACAMVSAFRKMKWQEIGLMLVLVALLPFAMTCITVVSTESHALMRYAVFLYYVLILAVFQLKQRKNWVHLVPILLIAVVLMNNVQVSNTAYEKKDLEQQATLSTMTRVLDRLEEYEDYVYGESEVAVMGVIQTHEEPLKVGTISGITGMEYTSQITYYPNMEEYFSIVLKTPMNMSNQERMKQLRQTEEFKAMGTFPAKNCIATIDGVIVVKMS